MEGLATRVAHGVEHAVEIQKDGGKPQDHSQRPFFSMGTMSLGQMGGPTSRCFMSMLTRNPHLGQAAFGAGRGAE